MKRKVNNFHELNAMKNIYLIHIAFFLIDRSGFKYYFRMRYFSSVSVWKD